MARRHYHRDLLGTTFTMAGLALVVGVWLIHIQSPAVLLVAYGGVACGATWLARQLYEDLAASEAGFAAALVVSVMFGIRTWRVGELAYQPELAGWAALAMASGAVGVVLAMQLPRARWRPVAIVSGFVTLSAHLVPAGFAIALDAPEIITVIAAVLGCMFGGAVAARVVVDATVSNVYWGTVAALGLAIVVAPLLHGDASGLVGMVIVAPLWSLGTALGAWLAQRRRTASSAALPEARAL